MTVEVEEVEQEDFLAHYGKKGMKWGQRKAARIEKNASIDGARARQGQRSAEINSLTAQRMTAKNKKGKAQIDSKLADKNFELKNSPDARQAAQLKTGEKVMKGVKVAAMLGLSVAGLGIAANIVNDALNDMDNSGNRNELLTLQARANSDNPLLSSKIETIGNPEAYGRALGEKIARENPGLFKK